MEQRQLGSHGPQLTTIGFGAWAVGGHFAAMEAPDLFVGDVRTFFRRFR